LLFSEKKSKQKKQNFFFSLPLFSQQNRLYTIRPALSTQTYIIW